MLFKRVNGNFRILNHLKKSSFVRLVTTSQFKVTEDDVEEVKIPMPWGHIAGKWWGKKNSSPVLAIHGWQDNANSFDKLIPLLNVPSVLAIDLPGHGLSSHLPEGKAYDFQEHIIMIHRIKKHFNWPQLSLLTHSFGGALGYAYTSMFSDNVKYLINLECGRALMTLLRVNLSTAMSQGVDTLLKIEKQKKENSCPAYKLFDMIKMSIEGSLGSIASPEAAYTVLKRGIYEVNKPDEKSTNTFEQSTDLKDFILHESKAVMSLKDDEKEHLYTIFTTLMDFVEKGKEKLESFPLGEKKDKYYAFTRDPSIKVLIFQSFDEDFLIEASKNIKCPVLSLRAKNGFLFGSTKKLYEETLNILKTNSKYSEHHDVDGTHHAHLNNPKDLVSFINSFIEKCKWWGSKNLQTILCLHGWQDNANTFNTLIPHLSTDFSYLAVDLPGHGLSSHFPKGLFYQIHEDITTIRKIQLYFNWIKLPLIGHSYGAACSFLFSSLFPSSVNFFVAIDTIKPLSKDSAKEIKNASQNIEKMLVLDSRSLSSAPVYSKDDILQRWVKASNNSLTEKSCEILMKRGTVIDNGLFKLTRDCRVKTSLAREFSQKEILKLAESIICPVLFVKSGNALYFEKKENVFDVIDTIKRKVKYFEQHTLPGTHHIHLNNPEVVAPVINSFIKTIANY